MTTKMMAGDLRREFQTNAYATDSKNRGSTMEMISPGNEQDPKCLQPLNANAQSFGRLTDLSWKNETQSLKMEITP